MNKIDTLIEACKKGSSINQCNSGNRYYQLVYVCNSFWLEAYEIDVATYKERLINVECIDEETARFSLTAKY